MTAEDVRRILDETELHRAFGMELIKAGTGGTTLRMPLNALTERLPASGQFHGGAIAALIDVAGDMALIATLGHGVPTINFRVDFLRPAPGPSLLASAVARRVGRTVAVVDIDVTDAEGRVVAIGRGCYSSKAG